MRRSEFAAIGTQWVIEVHSEISDRKWAKVQAAIAEYIDDFDARFSRFRPDSWVVKCAERPGVYRLDSDAYALLSFYEALYRATDGSVTPLIGRTMESIGYDARYSLAAGEAQASPLWEEAIEYDEDSMTLHCPVLLDFGAAGKGYLVDRVAEIVERAGIDEYVIDAGGDMVQKGRERIVVGLENPFNRSEVVGTIGVHNQSLCASSGSRRVWGKYHHIVHPTTLESPRDIVATWVLARDTMTADGLATALFFVPAAKLKSFNFAYAVLQSDMSFERSAGFRVEEIYEKA